jgi:predicted hotdog family 3-hydroxylacyl-ACP dehydratase
MCLLDEVLDWSTTTIRCRAATHRSPDNPLRAHGQLGAACGIEYAAQAMAVHGVLLAGTAAPPRGGVLASTRGVTFAVARLDDCAGDLVASATYVHGDAAMVLYDFSVADAERVLLSGRATIAFARPAPAHGADRG